MVANINIKSKAKERTYQVNGITYIVTPKYLDEGEDNMRTRFERIIKNNLTHLTDAADDDTIKAEYVLSYKKSLIRSSKCGLQRMIFSEPFTSLWRCRP